MTADTIDVRIVGEPWTGDALSLLAIAVSVATLGWTLWVRRRDQAHVRIRGTISIPLGTPGPAERLIGLTITNGGRTGATVLEQVHLQVGRRGGHLNIIEYAHGVGPSYPRHLEPGESVNMLIDPRGVAAACRDHSINPGQLRVVVETGHGTTTRQLTKACRWLIKDVTREVVTDAPR